MSEVEGWYSLGEIFELWFKKLKRHSWQKKYHDATSYIGKLKALRAYYNEFEKDIVEYHASGKRGWYDSYPVDWTQLFTPIEQEAWNSIRCKGNIALYPQYPVLNYFIDFGNPYFKIGLELDGKEFHDRDKDVLRDRMLKREGWIIYHITGSEMVNTNYKNFDEYEEWELEERRDQIEDSTMHWLRNTGDGVIESIKRIHFCNNHSRLWSRFLSFCELSLEEHKLI